MYEYIEQPSGSVIDCNPYGEILRLQCAITAPLNEEVNINWYYHNDNITTKLTDQLETSTEDVISETFRSVLTLTNIQPAVDTGDYYCQAIINSSNLLRSDSFTLSSDEIEFINFRDCESEDIFYTSVTKCADIVPIVTPSYSTIIPIHYYNTHTSHTNHSTTDYTFTHKPHNSASPLILQSH